MVTIEEVAKSAGVSTMTVSRVFNNPEKVKKSTRDKINKVIEELGYRPNLLAKSLVRGKSKTIGIISSNMYNQTYTDIIVAIEEIAYREGFVIINADVNTHRNATQALDMLLGNQIDGIILLPLEMEMNKKADYREALKETYSFLQYLKNLCTSYGVKVVTVSQEIEGYPDVAFNFAEQCRISLDYLIGKGYKDIAMLNSSYPEGLWKDKEDMYVRVMEQNGLSEYINVAHEQNVEWRDCGEQAMEAILEKHLPQAVYCANDYMAAGAIHALYKRGKRVPEDVAVIGNDDIYVCQYTSPMITTVALGSRIAGETAIRTLLGGLNGEGMKSSEISPYLVERESVT